jgi:hypothetical protein
MLLVEVRVSTERALHNSGQKRVPSTIASPGTESGFGFEAEALLGPGVLHRHFAAFEPIRGTQSLAV